jgi:hypothetical protein
MVTLREVLKAETEGVAVGHFNVSDVVTFDCKGNCCRHENAATVAAEDHDDLKGTLKRIGGSHSDDWNNNSTLAQSPGAGWRKSFAVGYHGLSSRSLSPGCSTSASICRAGVV